MTLLAFLQTMMNPGILAISNHRRNMLRCHTVRPQPQLAGPSALIYHQSRLHTPVHLQRRHLQPTSTEPQLQTH